MVNRNPSIDPASIPRKLFRWFLLIVPISIVVGSLVALFLKSLELVTEIRWQFNWFLYLLPIAGLLIYLLYKYSGKNAEAGNNLIIDEIHKPGGGVPARMGPLVFFTTLITHLFGGSAGREGTAVQMGGSMAALYARWVNPTGKEMQILLMCGVAAGFGAVFGTPLAGTVFAVEVIIRGRIRYQGILPCLISALIADAVCLAWGVQHTHYAIVSRIVGHDLLPYIHFNLPTAAKAILAGVAFGLAGFLFSWLLHLIKKVSHKLFAIEWLIPLAGGLLVIILCYVAGTRDYLGLGVTTKSGQGISIVNSFIPDGVDTWSWLWKLVFTAVTLGTGFKGGEVTPLFFIGATLGNVIASVTHAPVDLFAGLGFIAVFAGATNTPLACTFLGVELFGGEYVIYYLIACFAAFYFSGHNDIYTSKRVHHYKLRSHVKRIASRFSGKT